MAKANRITTVTDEVIVDRIYVVRGQKVMLDEDLAELYQVPTGRLNEQVKRWSSWKGRSCRTAMTFR